MSPTNLSLHTGIPESAQALMWNIFFESRNRGISLAHHFPWINDLEKVYCISIEDALHLGANKTIATLALKQASAVGGQLYGMIGLVCVDEKFRGLGLSSLLIERAIQVAVDLRWTALVLWTQKPEVYQSHGFVTDGEELLANITNNLAVVTNEQLEEQFTHQDDVLLNVRGFPSFATGLKLLESDAVTALVLKIQSGFSVAQWTGDNDSVADLLVELMPKFWGINFIQGDGLIEVLMKKGLEVNIKSSSIRMVRKLVHESDIDLRHIRILDRI